MNSLEQVVMPRVGDHFRHEVLISSDMVQAFVKLSGDDSPIHVDEAFAQARGYEGPICHGILLTAFVSRILGTWLPGKESILKSIQMEFRNPAKYPCTVQVEVRVTKVFQSVGMIRLAIEISHQQDEIIARGLAECVVRTSEVAK